MGGACGTYGGERCAQGVVGKSKGKTPVGDPNIDEKIILR
jgi:hypothetical protein